MQGSGLYESFGDVTSRGPHRPAVIDFDGRTWSYEELLAGIETAAEQLARVAKGDVLGLADDEPVAFLAWYLAAAKLGIVTVLLDSQLSAPELERSVTKYDISWLAGDELRHVARERPSTGYEPGDFVVHCTSGSTGEPKGIVMSEAAIAARVRLWAGDLDLSPADVVLCALPLSHCHGIDVLTLPALLSGATVVFARGRHLTARGFARRVEEHGVTLVSGLPIMYQMLTAASGVKAGALRSLRLAISGSAPLPVSTQQDFLERFGLPLRQVYGLSEIGVICFDKAYVGGGSVGLPVSGIEWRLEPVDEQLHEIHVRGPALARGYYRDSAATGHMFQDGWLRTRDFVLAEPDGWYVRGRQSGFINVAGTKVGPLEVEAALRECPGVRECAVAGVPDDVSTEQVAALIVVDEDFELSLVKRLLAERLLPSQLPQRYEIVAALPRTPLGKVDYSVAKRLLIGNEVAVG